MLFITLLAQLFVAAFLSVSSLPIPNPQANIAYVTAHVTVTHVMTAAQETEVTVPETEINGQVVDSVLTIESNEKVTVASESISSSSTMIANDAESSSLSSVPTSSVPAEALPTPSSAVEVSSSDSHKQEAGSNGNQSDIPTGESDIKAPEGTCAFPWSTSNDQNVVPITPNESNGGWAMSPNQQCKPGTWCPYACAPGYYSAQWDPEAKVYNGAGSMNGGLFCGNDGKLSKPFTDRPFCVRGVPNVEIENKLSSSVSACQTIYPGNEAMLIPTVVKGGAKSPMNVVPKTYWLGTSSQYYVNLAGSDDQQCIWGNDDKPIGNWGPYIFGAGEASTDITYISIQYNPLYRDQGFDMQAPFSARIECTGGQCDFPEGGECKCEHGQCTVKDGCTVAVHPGAAAKFVLY